MIKQRIISGTLSRKNSNLRKKLATLAREIRGLDRDHSKSLLYRTDRALEESPFGKTVKAEVIERVKKGRISILEKGAGHGNLLASLKKINPQKISATAITLSKTISKQNKQHIDREVRGLGLRKSAEEKFDIICDSYGEDYNLYEKRLLKYSVLQSISRLKKGGVLFTVFPLFLGKKANQMKASEGRAFLESLKKKGLLVVWQESKLSKLPTIDGKSSYESIEVILIIKKPA